MAADLGIPIIEKVDLKDKQDLAKVKQLFDESIRKQKEETGRGSTKMTILIGEGNFFKEALLCSTSKKYMDKVIGSNPEQIKQKGKIDRLRCVLIDV